MGIEELKQILHDEHCSCVVCKDGDVRLFYGRGVRDLHTLLRTEPDFLKGALLVDKIIGRAAAALIICAEIKEFYTNVISLAALDLLSGTDIKFTYTTSTDYIINRKGDGSCPLELTTKEIEKAEDIVALIDNWKFPFQN